MVACANKGVDLMTQRSLPGLCSFEYKATASKYSYNKYTKQHLFCSSKFTMQLEYASKKAFFPAFTVAVRYSFVGHHKYTHYCWQYSSPLMSHHWGTCFGVWCQRFCNPNRSVSSQKHIPTSFEETVFVHFAHIKIGFHHAKQ